MSTNYFQAKPEKPFHLSVCALLLDENQNLVTHYYKEYKQKGSLYLLMRETVEEGESLEQTLSRGLKEEFGATGEIVTYLGSEAYEDSWFKDNPTNVQKTTLFFVVKLVDIDESLRKSGDDESESEIVRVNIDELIKKSIEQYDRFQWNDLEISDVLKRLKNHL